MKDIKFRAWDYKENKMYYRGYQRWFTVLLCEDDKGANEGKGWPVKKVSYGDCTLLEGTGLMDKNQREIYEGDIVRIRHLGKTIEGLVEAPPDMFGSRQVHTLQSLLKKNGISGNPDNLEIEVLGNEYENPTRNY